MNRTAKFLAIALVALAAGCASFGYQDEMASDIRYCNMASLRGDPLVSVPFVNLVSTSVYRDEIRREFDRCTRDRGYVCTDSDPYKCSRKDLPQS